ncbi:MAG: hypothetical protein D6692_05110 [Planctomycetota bacterium]|nr:MAG: hypothetical protein D6692_05110 [Planctomycetota bacterium]
MNPTHIPRPLWLRLAFVCLLAIIGRFAILKPAHASLNASRMNLAAQQEESASMDSEAIHAAKANADRILSVAGALESRLNTNAGANWTVNQFERLAASNSVRILRMSPRGSPGIDKRAEDGPRVIADEFSLEISGSFAGVAAFLSALEEDVGVLEIESLRMNGTSPDTVSASLDVIRYHLARGERLIETEEAGYGG